MDITSFEKSMEMPLDEVPYIDKEVLYVNDSNNGSYSSSIQFDTTVLSNSGKWLDYSEATLEIPYVVSMKSSTDITSHVNSYMMALKSGHHHIIDSLQVQINNSNAVQQQSYTNFHVNYKILSSWSHDDLTKWGPQTGVAPDSPASFTYSGSASAAGVGYMNNRPYPVAATKTYTDAVAKQEANEGLRERIEDIAPEGGYGSLGIMTTSGQHDSAGKTYFSTSGSGADAVYSIKVLATIRLKDVSDFFSKIPIARGVQMRFNIIYNSARVNVATVVAGPTMSISDSTITQLSGNTVPFMVCDSTANSPMNAAVANGAAGTFSYECGVVSTTNPAASASGMLSACRLYVPAYVLSPMAEERYLSLGEKRIEYDDIYEYTVSNVAAGSRFQQILTNGIVDPHYLVIVPMLNSTAGNYATAALTSYKSIFDSAPATTSPVASITDLNVLVSGRAIFQQDLEYDFDIYQNEVARVNALTGGVETGLTSGLLSRSAWDNGYRYYVVDLSRREQSEDVVPKSIQIKGQNNTSKIMDYYCFVVYRRSLTLDLISGGVRV